MTFISDLSARAIAFITAIQTSLVNAEVNTKIRTKNTSILTFSKNENPAEKLISKFQDEMLKEKFTDRAIELVGISRDPPKSDETKSNPAKSTETESNPPTIDLSKRDPITSGSTNNDVALNYTINLSANLVEWIRFNRKNGISKLQESHGEFPTPYHWRITIERILYENPVERITLAIALQYLPLQVVLAMGGGGFNATEQRILQIWNPKYCESLMALMDVKNFASLNWNNEDGHALTKIIKKQSNSPHYTLYEKLNTLMIKIVRLFPKKWKATMLKDENKNEILLKKLLQNKKEKKSDEMESVEIKFTGDAIDLLLNHSMLINDLVEKKVPLSFELVFSEELVEIELNRKKRKVEEIITAVHQGSTNEANLKVKEKDDQDKKYKDRIDPFEKAKQMGIRALAISGGGIRSATFNLGILQGFAEKKLIGKFDYLSTVSGGGYIGSFLTSWIKRNESVVKVSNRLCPQTSPDPTGAELKPIKWLRMYSNYFAPNASLMSVDSWTVGITWLRNTLLNQIVLFLLFLAVLFAGNSIYQIWALHLVHDLYPTWPEVLLWSILFLLPVALLSGLGMSVYDKKDLGRRKMLLLGWIRTIWIMPIANWKYRITISQGIIGYTIFGAYIVSAWLSSGYYNTGVPATSIEEKLIIFLPAAILAFVCLLLVSYLGNYTKHITNFQKRSKSFARFILLFATLFSALFGWIALAFVSVFLEQMPDLSFGSNPTYIIDKTDLQFILGIPLIIEVFVFSIIARMALLGKYFPDERREWWGRIGADVHRMCFFWILIFTSALLGWTFIQYAYANYAAPTIAATGGWVALVGICVKAAFSSKTAEKGEEKGRYATFLSILSMAGPYLFILGLMILLPALTKPLLRLLQGALINFGFSVPGILCQNLLVMFFCAIVALFLGKQLGVNEFSMYNFYKNRLVRAYLGGTRRSTKRQKSANPYTGFDMGDDEYLYTFCHAEGYHGPYHILNCALNASQGQELDRQDRKAESFIFSPLYCGFDFSMARDPDDKDKAYDYAYRQTKEYAFKGEGPYIGTAMAISGAAVNPNQGYHSSPPIAFLLTVFNAQMGRWLGNPRKSSWQKPDPPLGLSYIISNLINKSTTRDEFVSLSDGGHFDNMGLYEMIRRKCSYIILCDAEQDNQFTCEGLANAIRRCRIDFGAEIIIDISKITDRTNDRYSKTHYALGNITYVGEKQTGVLLYIKSSITGDEPVDVYEYALKNKTFPHQTTADQFFDEEQFESYRKLGLHIAREVMADNEVIKAFDLEDKKQIWRDTLNAMEYPFRTFYNKIKNFLFKGN